MNLVESILNTLRNKTFNSLGVERDLLQLIQDRDISRAKNMFQNRDADVSKAILEYNPTTHDVMKRPDKPRKGKAPYKVEKLPRTRQRYINEVELFFLLGKPIKWKNNSDNTEETDEAFKAFNEFLKDIRFDTAMRQGKRLAGAETESAKVYHIYNDNGVPKVKILVIAKSKGYTLRPLFDQYENMIAFGYGYYLNENGKTIEHFDIETPSCIYKCKHGSLGWDVDMIPNPTGKINIIYNRQPKAWDGTQSRCDREEFLDSRTGDTNNYFADPKVKATADVIKSLADPSTVGEVIQLQGKDSSIEYLAPPSYSDMKDSEKKDLNNSILFDSFTPDFSFENMKGMGTLSGEALKRAMTLGYIKRDNLKEIYDILVDREKNLLLSIMMNVTHVHLREKLSKLKIGHEFAEPFNEDQDKRWGAIGQLYKDGIISTEKAIEMLALVDDPKRELSRILKEKQNLSADIEITE